MAPEIQMYEQKYVSLQWLWANNKFPEIGIQKCITLCIRMYPHTHVTSVQTSFKLQNIHFLSNGLCAVTSV